MADQPTYRSFLLRLWQVNSANGVVWRASLEDARTGLRLGFSSIRRLHEFLLDQTETHNNGETRSTNDATSAASLDDAP
jgi:hypothetical protein